MPDQYVQLDGQVYLELKISNKPVRLTGKFTSDQSETGSSNTKTLNAEFHAKSLDDAIDLGNLKDAVKNLKKIFLDNDFSKLINFIPIPDPLPTVDTTKFSHAIYQIGSIVKQVQTLALANDSDFDKFTTIYGDIEFFITDIALHAVIDSNVTNAVGDITLGLAIKFPIEWRIFNFQLVSAGISITGMVNI